MGVAIFAARKIALLNSISNLETMRMQLSILQQQKTDQVMNLTMQAQNTQLNMSQMGGGGGSKWGAIGQLAAGIGGAAGSIWGGQENGAQYGQIGAAAGSMIGAIGSLFGGGGGGGGDMMGMQQENLRVQQQIMVIQQEEKRLEMQAKALETQLGLKNKELEGVEQAEQKAIERSGPKYGD